MPAGLRRPEVRACFASASGPNRAPRQPPRFSAAAPYSMARPGECPCLSASTPQQGGGKQRGKGNFFCLRIGLQGAIFGIFPALKGPGRGNFSAYKGPGAAVFRHYNRRGRGSFSVFYHIRGRKISNFARM